MTGFNSKRNAAKAKLDDDDDTQVYADTLLIVYQRGFADGKKAAQRKPLTDEEMMRIYVELKSVAGFYSVEKFARAIEAAHGIKEQP
jgi:hypothetical protein